MVFARHVRPNRQIYNPAAYIARFAESFVSKREMGAAYIAG